MDLKIPPVYLAKNCIRIERQHKKECLSCFGRERYTHTKHLSSRKRNYFRDFFRLEFVFDYATITNLPLTLDFTMRGCSFVLISRKMLP